MIPTRDVVASRSGSSVASARGPAVRWEQVAGAAEWDADLEVADDRSVFQSSGWGEHKRHAGWLPMRWRALDRAGAVVMLVQVLARRAPGGATIGWAPGGPVLGPGGTRAGLAGAAVRGLVHELAQTSPRMYLRFDAYRPYDQQLAYEMARVCQRPSVPINTGYSTVLDTTAPVEAFLGVMDKKHRYAVRRALDEGLVWDVGRGPDLVRSLVELYASMSAHKRIDDLPLLEAGELLRLLDVLGDGSFVLRGRLDGDPVTAALIVAAQRRAFYYAAATSVRGRAVGAAYATVHRLYEELHGRGVQLLDLGGLDPRQPTPGVDHFKLGFGGRLIGHLGEWEWATHAWLSAVVGVAIRYRRGLQRLRSLTLPARRDG